MRIDTDCRIPAFCVSGTRKSRGPWLRLLSAVLELAGPCAELLRHAERPWASATFSGTRHTIALSFTAAEAISAGEEFIAALPDHEFSISGQLVADAAIALVEHEAGPNPKMTVEAELLLLEDV
jgi:hypothetical protein